MLPPHEQRELTQMEIELSSDPTLAGLARRLGSSSPGSPRGHRAPSRDGPATKSLTRPAGRKRRSWKSLTAVGVLAVLIALAVVSGFLEPAALPAVIIAIVATTLVCAAAGGVWASSQGPADGGPPR